MIAPNNIIRYSMVFNGSIINISLSHISAKSKSLSWSKKATCVENHCEFGLCLSVSIYKTFRLGTLAIMTFFISINFSFSSFV